VADIAIFPWYGNVASGEAYGAGEFLQVADYKNVQRWTAQIGARAAVRRGRLVNRIIGDEAGQLRERHAASDIDAKMTD
jgi:GST-like protein